MKIENFKLKIQKPKVSIVIPAYNAEKTLSETIESILNQTYNNWELIIINDGSKDKTREIAQKYQQKYPEKISVLFQNNKGPATARNKGFKKAKGDFLVWVDADDVWLKNRLQKIVGVLNTNSNIDLVTTDAYYWIPESKEKPSKKFYDAFKKDLNLNFKNLLRSNFVFTSCIMRKNVFKKCQLNEDMNLMGTEDYEFWLNVVYNKFKLKIIFEPLVLYRQSSTSLSTKNLHNNYALEKIFQNILDNYKLTNSETEVTKYRLEKFRLYIAQNEAENNNLNTALEYFAKTNSSWSKISIWLIRNKMIFLWKMFFAIKKLMRNLK